MSLLGHLYTSPLRSLLRKSGGIALYRSLRGSRESEAPNEPIPEHFPVAEALVLAGQRIEVRCEDEGSVRRTRSMRSDARLIEALMGELGAGDTFWDVGASLGVYSMIAARRVGDGGRVVSFEPESRSFKWLGANLELNGLRNIRALNLALGRAEAMVELTVTEFAGSGAHTLIAGQLGKDSSGTEKVRVARGDAIALELGLPTPNAIKIDVEGFEFDVLCGLGDLLSAPTCKALLCEIHFSQLEHAGRSKDVELLRVRLRDAGFRKETWLDPSHLLVRKQPQR